MRKKVSSGTTTQSTSFIDATGPKPMKCERCGETSSSPKKIGPGSWECEHCRSVISNSAPLPKLQPGESDQIYEQAVSSAPKSEAAEILAPIFGGPTMTSTGKLCSADTVRVTWGPEKITTRKYCTIDVGPFEYTTIVEDGESNIAAMKRAQSMLDHFAATVRKERVAAFMKYLEETFGPARD